MSDSGKDPSKAGQAPATAGLPAQTARPLGPNEAKLLKAVRALDAARVEWLIGQEADVNAQDAAGMTPLHIAASLGARPVIRVLVASGRCDYLIRDAQGRYAFELAIEWARDYAVARLLQKKQANQAAAQGVPAYVPRVAQSPR